jgi:hypothetical protein
MRQGQSKILNSTLAKQNIPVLKQILMTDWGARKLTGENLRLVWAEFSTIS